MYDQHEYYFSNLHEECPECLFEMCQCSKGKFNHSYGKDKLERAMGGNVKQDEAIDYINEAIWEEWD